MAAMPIPLWFGDSIPGQSVGWDVLYDPSTDLKVGESVNLVAKVGLKFR